MLPHSSLIQEFSGTAKPPHLPLKDIFPLSNLDAFSLVCLLSWLAITPKRTIELEKGEDISLLRMILLATDATYLVEKFHSLLWVLSWMNIGFCQMIFLCVFTQPYGLCLLFLVCSINFQMLSESCAPWINPAWSCLDVARFDLWHFIRNVLLVFTCCPSMSLVSWNQQSCASSAPSEKAC